MIKLLRRRESDREPLKPRDKVNAATWVFHGHTSGGHRRTVAKLFEEAREAARLKPEIVLLAYRLVVTTLGR